MCVRRVARIKGVGRVGEILIPFQTHFRKKFTPLIQKGESRISPVVNIAVKSINRVTKLKEIIANERSSDLLVTQIFLVSTIKNGKENSMENIMTCFKGVHG